jgi:hypothetical protein
MIATSIASFGVQYNYTNTSIAFLFLKNDQSNKWSDYE